MRVLRLIDGSEKDSRVQFGTGEFDWFEFNSSIVASYQIGEQVLLFTADGRTYVLMDSTREICKASLTEIGWPGRRMGP